MVLNVVAFLQFCSSQFHADRLSLTAVIPTSAASFPCSFAATGETGFQAALNQCLMKGEGLLLRLPIIFSMNKAHASSKTCTFGYSWIALISFPIEFQKDRLLDNNRSLGVKRVYPKSCGSFMKLLFQTESYMSNLFQKDTSRFFRVGISVIVC